MDLSTYRKMIENKIMDSIRSQVDVQDRNARTGLNQNNSRQYAEVAGNMEGGSINSDRKIKNTVQVAIQALDNISK